MTTTNRHEPAAERGLEPRSGPVAGANGTNVPRHSDPIHDHWDEAWRLGYLQGYHTGHDDGHNAGLERAANTLTNQPAVNTYTRWALDDAAAAIRALRSEP